MKLTSTLTLLVVLFSSALCAEETFQDEFEETEETAKSNAQEYVAPSFKKPSIDEKHVNFVDWFDDTKGIGRTWFKSNTKKEDTDETIAKYDGEWSIGTPTEVTIEGDYGLIVKTKARHHAIAAKLTKPFHFKSAPLVVQYEVKYQEGQECGGGYIKLLSEGAEKSIQNFNDKTPYTIMFGPDKCGVTSKVHFIVRHKNPKNGSISEHHAKQSTQSLAAYFDDKKTHLYTLVVKPDESFSVSVDNYQIMSGSLLTDLQPAIEPPKEIEDPTDKKPSDWDERETIEDPDATKPEDWDESQPREVVDEDAVKPDDWLEEEEPLIPDPNAEQPEDWDESMDGEWEPKKITNPACEGRSGCGTWKRPLKQNPLYKGKWSPPKIANPAYKGRWSARLIANPHHFEAEPFKQLSSITAIGFELWTMSAGIVFDNILVADDEAVASDLARQTFSVKVEQEKLFHKANNPSESVFASILSATEEKPWLWAVYVLAVLVPVVGISVFYFGRKSATTDESYTKKTDEPVPDDEDESAAENDEVVNGGDEEVKASNVKTIEKRTPALSKDDLEEDNDVEEEEEDEEEEKVEKPKPSPQTRKRVRKQD